MLAEILAHKRTEIEQLDLASLRSQAQDAPAPRDFAAALTSGGSNVKLIAELKRASPSRGLLAPHLNMFELAQIYADNGASAISVLTDQKFFLGSLDTLCGLRFEHQFALPLLRKDFMLAPVQLYESRAAGADAILLIVAALPDDGLLHDLHAQALDLGLTPLVEVHDGPELERALRLPDLRLLGINNRDLKTFNVSRDTTLRLRPLVPAGITVISESGLFTRDHVQEMATANIDAILVGEALVTAPDIGAKVRGLARDWSLEIGD